MNPLISIIVAVYNTEKYLEETIRSVMQQSYENWELILVDDGSTDSSAVIIQKFSTADTRIHYHNKINGGQASARNLGIHLAKGEYITFLDSDDLYTAEKLEKQFALFSESNCDFLYGGGFYLYENRLHDKVVPYEWYYGEFSGSHFFRLLFRSCAVNINSVLVKKEFLLKVGLFDESEELRGTEDIDLWLRISLHSTKIIGNSEKLVYYRIHDDGIHLKKAKMLIGKWKIYEKYENHPYLSKLYLKREYRYIFRELMNALQEENRLDEIAPVFRNYLKKDRFSFVSIFQRILFPLVSLPQFLLISNKLIYRIGYRLERITYLFITNGKA